MRCLPCVPVYTVRRPHPKIALPLSLRSVPGSSWGPQDVPSDFLLSEPLFLIAWEHRVWVWERGRDSQREGGRDRGSGGGRKGRRGGREGRVDPPGELCLCWCPCAVPRSLNLSTVSGHSTPFLVETEHVTVDMALGSFGFLEGLKEDTGCCGKGRFWPYLLWLLGFPSLQAAREAQSPPKRRNNDLF